MLPKKELNIYPKNENNVNSLISFYFDDLDLKQNDACNKILNKTSITLNQFEFILKKINQAYTPIFRKELKGEIELTNLIQYGLDALAEKEINWSGSINRKRITKIFKEFVESTEIDYKFLEKNN